MNLRGRTVRSLQASLKRVGNVASIFEAVLRNLIRDIAGRLALDLRQRRIRVAAESSSAAAPFGAEID